MTSLCKKSRSYQSIIYKTGYDLVDFTPTHFLEMKDINNRNIISLSKKIFGEKIIYNPILKNKKKLKKWRIYTT